ncbi:3-oxo-tetronate kinase [Sinomonas terrae]|uniref:3-oxo-tetronate kinase n=1 Tax=Sinomonas terrae TaxID=2908838 RepID=A0ABS9U5J6_9MICC|nr:3-oxo-tetronate kinase [Sinomonas terrae]MCH6471954.1 four-carbon acid sugar kinase family protein [Sinomonas terrae]
MRWGCIADDVTGATDLATAFVSRGLVAAVHFGVPSRGDIEQLEGLDVLVVALKSRTAPPADAVGQSLAALEALLAAGAERFYVKYCSTFDSTPSGNIGPVIDAVLGRLGEPGSVVVPSFPDTGRTVYQGRLFVGSDPLDESPMREHPLTPMRDSSLARLLEPQTQSEVSLVPLQTVHKGSEALREELLGLIATGRERPTLVIVDAIDRDDLATIMEAAEGLKVITGGSGLALGIPAGDEAEARRIPRTPGRRAVLCGSASARTREQIASGKALLPFRKLDLEALRNDVAAEAGRIIDWARDLWSHEPSAVPLVFSAESVDDLAQDRDTASALVEQALAAIAVGMVREGVRELIVAGGESSGRVVQELGVKALRIGPAISPGVAWANAIAADGTSLSLALKSGNFGERDMFTTAWSALEGAAQPGEGSEEK